MKLTRSAVERLKALLLEHPEDPIVRVQAKAVDDQRLAFGSTLESRVQSDDQTQATDGLTVAIPTASAMRMDGIIRDYQNPGWFKFHHSGQQNDPRLNVVNLN